MAILVIKELNSETLREILKEIKGLEVEVLDGQEEKSSSVGTWEDLEEEIPWDLPEPTRIH